MEKIVAEFQYADGSAAPGSVEVTRGEYPNRTVIGMQLRVRGVVVKLPWQRMDELLKVLVAAYSEASANYTLVLKEMNNELQEKEPR